MLTIGYAAHELGVVGGHLGRGLGARPRRCRCRPSQNSEAATSRASAMSVPSAVAGLLDGLGDQVERGPVGVEVGREAALVADAGRQPAALQHAT